MSRSGYVDDFDDMGMLNLYRGTVQRAIEGKRGQAFLREMAVALDAMPEKKLIKNELVDNDGMVCAIGAVCKARGLDVTKVDPDDPDSVGKAVGISRSLAAEIEYMNDEYLGRNATPEQVWEQMRKWVRENLV